MELYPFESAAAFNSRSFHNLFENHVCTSVRSRSLTIKQLQAGMLSICSAATRTQNMHLSTHVCTIPRVLAVTCPSAQKHSQTNSLSNKLLLHSVTHIYSPELKVDCFVIGAQQKQKTLPFKHTFTDALRNKQEINAVCADCVYVVSIHPCGSLHLISPS